MPDISPKKGPDDTCAKYTAQPGDSCYKIDAQNGIEPGDLEKFNKDTWGWNGCNKLQVKQNICLSDGSPPFPEVVGAAVCGPTKPGTPEPSIFILSSLWLL